MSLPERLEAQGLVLRRLQLSDRDALAAAVAESLDAIATWMPWAHPNYGSEDASTFLATVWLGWLAKTQFEFAIVAPDHGELLGVCGLNQRAEDSMNLGYWTHTAHAGRGIATRATQRLARFGFEDVGLRRISLYHAIDNVGSQRVAEKAGFQREGRQRGRLVLHGVAHDCFSYGLLAGDF